MPVRQEAFQQGLEFSNELQSVGVGEDNLKRLRSWRSREREGALFDPHDLFFSQGPLEDVNDLIFDIIPGG